MKCFIQFSKITRNNWKIRFTIKVIVFKNWKQLTWCKNYQQFINEFTFVTFMLIELGVFFYLKNSFKIKMIMNSPPMATFQWALAANERQVRKQEKGKNADRWCLARAVKQVRRKKKPSSCHRCSTIAGRWVVPPSSKKIRVSIKVRKFICFRIISVDFVNCFKFHWIEKWRNSSVWQNF